jgi:hypothetical protein
MALLFRSVAHLNRPDGINCADEKMSLKLPIGKNAQKSKVLTFEQGKQTHAIHRRERR